MTLALPQDITLPLFAYGSFQPGELCHRRLKPFLALPPTADRVLGTLLVRDGLPLATLESGPYPIEGSVLHFRPDSQRQAYEDIASFEPSELYRWENTITSDRNVKVNILVVRRPSKGHAEQFEGGRWSHRDDPVFREGLRVVAESVREFAQAPFESSPPKTFDWPRFFRLQMAYLLLWAAIERYTAFAFGPALEPMDRVKRLGALEQFQAAVRAHVSRTDVVTDSRNLDSYRLDPQSPAAAALYYYQIRNNLSHRGKGAWNDGELVRKALRELLQIVGSILGV